MTPNNSNHTLADAALAAPNLWGQVYLGCRWLYGIPHQAAEAVADEAEKSFEGDLCTGLDDLHWTINEIARAD
ncbi:Uncharacterised protein [Bordetella trematum]|uniref:hypothetical protein n=1 Tax=Bordetella trematum TaxID=123899 RepID=UPI0007974245|nr:hypothetical protein [Bordetella trematum]SAI62967.1 Uncharacterised protein [Bordetella trematum]